MNELVKQELPEDVVHVLTSNNIEISVQENLISSFMPFFAEAKTWALQAGEINVKSIDDHQGMEEARAARLALKAIRVEANKTRKSLKEDSLRYGKAVQGFYDIIAFLIVPAEKDLQEKEDFIKLEQARKIAELSEERSSELTPYSEYVPMGLHLGGMSADDYQKLFNGCRAQFEQSEALRIAEEKKVAEDARKQAQFEDRTMKVHTSIFKGFFDYEYLTKDTTGAEFDQLCESASQQLERQNEIQKKEDAKIEAYNEKVSKIQASKYARFFDFQMLTKDASKEDYELLAESAVESYAAHQKELDEQIKKEEAQKVIDAKAEKERLKQELILKLELEKVEKTKAKQDEKDRLEAVKLAEFKDKERKKAAAPDKEKLQVLASDLLGYKLPQLSSPEGKAIIERVSQMLKKVSADINTQIEKI